MIPKPRGPVICSTRASGLHRERRCLNAIAFQNPHKQEAIAAFLGLHVLNPTIGTFFSGRFWPRNLPLRQLRRKLTSNGRFGQRFRAYTFGSGTLISWTVRLTRY